MTWLRYLVTILVAVIARIATPPPVVSEPCLPTYRQPVRWTAAGVAQSLLDPCARMIARAFNLPRRVPMTT